LLLDAQERTRKVANATTSNTPLRSSWAGGAPSVPVLIEPSATPSR
jgi:hypothetical protein